MANELQKTQEQKLSPIQRAQLFGQATRQHWQALPAISGGDGMVVSFDLPKVRLGSKVRLEVALKITASNTATPTKCLFAPFTYIKNVRMESNLGFTFFNLSGRDLYFYNILTQNYGYMDVDTPTAILSASSRARNVQGAGGTSGDVNTCRFMVDLPITLNKRDAIGLVLLQNPESIITVTVEFGTIADLVATTTNLTTSDVLLTPSVETFSIPAIQQAFPDISILKLVKSQTQAISATGVVNVKLPVGQTYRKLAWFIYDGNGAGVLDSSISGNFELVLNQADIPYRIKPTMLAAINSEEYGKALPAGLYAFDFTDQGNANYGGARDYIDTERLTEFWLRFNGTASTNITVIYESLVKLV